MNILGGGKLSDALTLRQKAEAVLTQRQKKPAPIRSESEILRIVQELELYQIEFEMVNEELQNQNKNEENRVAELILLNKKLATNLSLFKSNKKLKLLVGKRQKRAGELIVTNEELVFQSEEKEKRAAELIVANKELLFLNNEKAQRAKELILANIELLYQNDEKAKRAAELILANKKLLLLNDEKAKLSIELLLSNKELIFQNEEKSHRADELIVANIELLFQNQEKEKRAAELSDANKLISFQRDRLNEISSLLPGVVYQYSLRPDGTSCYPYVSESIYRIYQLTPEEVCEDATKMFTKIHPDDYDGVVASIQSSAKELTLWQHEYRLKFDDGTVRLLCGNAVPQAEADGSVLWHGFITDISERKQIELALKQSEESFRNVVALSPMASVVHRYKTIIYANPATLQMFGVENLHEMEGSSILDWLHSDFHEIVNIRTINSIASGLATPRIEIQYIRRDGTIGYAEVQSTPIIYDGLPSIHVSLNDISEHKRIEILLKENNSRLAIAMQMAKMAWWELDVATGKIHFDDLKVELLGFPPRNFNLNMEFTNFIHPDDLGKIMNAKSDFLSGKLDKFEVEHRILNQSGEYRWVFNNGTVIKSDENGIPLYLSGFIIDITERKYSEELLQKSEARYSSMISNISDVICILGADSIMKYVSSNVEKQFGWLPEELVGLKSFSFVHPADLAHAQKELQLFLESDEKTMTTEFRFRCKDGSYKSIEIMNCNLLNDPIINGMLVNLHDISERREREQEIHLKSEELQKLNSEKDIFFSIIAHDLRGPLGGFMALTKMIVDDKCDFTDDKIKEMTFSLSRSASNTFNLLENLLEWSQMNRGITEFQPQNLELTEVVTDCKNVVFESARGKGIELIVDIPMEYNVFADKNMVQTVIRNLLSNAIKFTPQGGLVTISANPAENNMIVISVKDTGIGMSDKMRNDLFRIDSNTKRPGTEGEKSTGLGLLLCKDFVAKQGGGIWVESEQDHGSLFSFTIPSIGPEGNEIAKPKVKLSEKPASQINNLKILIAENDEISAKLIHLMVKGFSREVFEVKTGNDAVEICRNNNDIDLVMMDIAMPFMDGYEATRQIRLFNKEVIIIAQTTFVFSTDREKAFEVGCNDYIQKPFGKEGLVELIKKHIK